MSACNKVHTEEYNDIIDVRKEAALFILKRINCNEESKKLWHEVCLHALFPRGTVKIGLNKDPDIPNDPVQSCNDSIDSDYLVSDCSSVEKFPEKRFDIDVALVSLNQLMSVSFNEYKSTELETAQLESETIGTYTNFLSDSGYNSENLKNICDLVEGLYNYVITSSSTPCIVNDKSIKKSLRSINEAACNHNEVTKKINDLIENSLLNAFSTLEDEDIKICSNFGNVLKVIQTVCKGNEIIILHKMTMLINGIIVNNKELVNKRSYNKLTVTFYLIDTLMNILNDYGCHLKKKSKMVKSNVVNSNVLQRIASLKKLKRMCNENLKLLSKYWFMSPVILNLQRCVSYISDVINLETVNR